MAIFYKWCDMLSAMLGVLLIIVASFFQEISFSLGKEEMHKKRESIYYFSFLTLLSTTVIFLVLSLITSESFIFSIKSLPTFSLRFLVEAALLFVAVKAVQQSDRTTAAYLRILTIPSILIISYAFGLSEIRFANLVGILIIFISIAVLFYKKILKSSYAYYGLLSSVLAAVTIGLYKYNISHFNSVLGEQTVMQGLLLVLVGLIILFKTKESMFSLFKNKLIVIQTISIACAGVLASFGYAFVSPVVAVATGRISDMIFSSVSGRIYFKEHNTFKKIIFIVPVGLGIMLLLM